MKNWILLVIAGLSFGACKEKKSIDVQPPVIESVTLDGNANATILKQAGEALHVVVSATDNSDLNQMQISLHPASDGHQHPGDGHLGGEDRLNSGKWAYSEIINLSGTSAQHEWDFQIPDSIAGNWHILVSLLDEVGLISTTYNALVQVENDNLPIVTGTTFPPLDDSGTVHVALGSNLSLTGLAEDVDGIKRMFMYTQNVDGVTGDTLNVTIVGDGHSMAFGPANLNQAHLGTFRAVIEAQDSLGYTRKWDAKIIVN